MVPRFRRNEIQEELKMAEATMTKVKIQPLGDRVLVKAVEQVETKRGGIIIPDSAKEKPQEGIVVACGKGKVTEDGKVLPMDVKIGDKVLFEKYGGSEIRLNDEELVIMHQDSIVGILGAK
jgi:chaperonin GroES